MDKLPLDILGPIFLYACTDSGQTGCALSLASKNIRTASRPARFHSVALVSGSPSQVVQFVACFSRECDLAGDAKPRVRHLCLAAAQRRKHLGPFDPWPPASAADPSDESKTAGDHEKQKETQRYLRDVMVIVEMLGPDLETLCLIDPEPRRNAEALHIPPVLSTGFPSLVELAIIGKEPVIRPTADACTPFYPRLRTLHRIHVPRIMRIPGFQDTEDWMLSSWRNSAPLLVEANVFQLGGMRFGAEIVELRQKLLADIRTDLPATMEEMLRPRYAGGRRAPSVQEVDHLTGRH
ncbi:hypothetical protein BV20DRAFT_941850 [Pilatotrama ljubarskyi]|nr:hypothetical protein BV20DRAFT_941850 [Pilatotrama ljubarskyi]